jgi:hypothetical protein
VEEEEMRRVRHREHQAFRQCFSHQRPMEIPVHLSYSRNSGGCRDLYLLAPI